MAAHHLDARGLVCPLPVLKARKALSRLSPGDILTIAVTDAKAPEEFRLFCAGAGHVLQSVARADGDDETLITVARGATP